MVKLFLDDLRIPMDCVSYMHRRIEKDNALYLQPWDIVRDYPSFVKYIEDMGLPEIVSFDHDLADEHYTPTMHVNDDDYNALYDEFVERTGYDCAKWLVNYCEKNNLPFPKYFIHSMNPVGVKNIESYIEGYKKIKAYESSDKKSDAWQA